MQVLTLSSKLDWGSYNISIAKTASKIGALIHSMKFLSPGVARNVASFSLFYRYYFGRCSSELAQLVPLPHSQGRSTHYSDRLLEFSVTICRCYKDVYVNSFFRQTLEFSTYKMLSFDLRSKWL